MALEIERKFLVCQGWMPHTAGTAYMQGYLNAGGEGPSVRVRIAGDIAFLTIKGPSDGLVRQEYEYPIPPDDARQMLANLSGGRLIQKTRYVIEHEGHTWEVDVFQGRNSGLIIAEVEISSPDEPVALPEWVADEVSLDHRYANAYLCLHPWPEWKDDRGKQ